MWFVVESEAAQYINTFTTEEKHKSAFPQTIFILFVGFRPPCSSVFHTSLPSLPSHLVKSVRVSHCVEFIWMCSR